MAPPQVGMILRNHVRRVIQIWQAVLSLKLFSNIANSFGDIDNSINHIANSFCETNKCIVDIAKLIKYFAK